MFDTLTQSFKNIANKIRFSDDERALKGALDELKKILLRNDVHHKVAKEILAQVEQNTKLKGIGKQNFVNALQESLQNVLKTSKHYGFTFASTPPTIVLMMGLQGSGKTTSTAKLGNYLKARGKKVLLAACDLQRLAAVEQLKQLGASIEVDVFAPTQDSQTPLQVAQAAKQKAISGHYDVLLVDTAGRLAIDEELMSELVQIKQSINPTECFYVADSLVGQDGVKTAAHFNEKIGIDGVILTKFDSDSKGGIALSIAYQIGVPLRFIGSGDKVAD